MDCEHHENRRLLLSNCYCSRKQTVKFTSANVRASYGTDIDDGLMYEHSAAEQLLLIVVMHWALLLPKPVKVVVFMLFVSIRM
jgi:hypothetical protein